MKLPIKRILIEAKADYEKAWLDSRNLLELNGHKFTLKPQGKAHALNDFIAQGRIALIDMGFEEIVLPMFVEEEDVYKEYGPEAALILDRLYYLAQLPRPDIGVSNEKIEQIHQIAPSFDKIKELQAIFRRYKKGEIEADDMLEVMVHELGIKEEEASAIIDKVFPEFKNLKPESTKTTLRSHTTALWFLMLEQMIKKKPLPLQYFLIGPKFRREQKQDPTHLYVSNTLSIVVGAEEITLEDGQNIGRQITQAIGFENVNIRLKTATSKYYAPQTEFEIFVQHPISKQWIEIGDGGFYSPVSLAKYNIDIPVLNIGFGCERITMIRTGEVDVRRLVYPYFYQDLAFTDEELANYLFYIHTPKTTDGVEIWHSVVQFATMHKDDPSPIELIAWEGKIKKRKVKITLFEHENNAKLLGKAALNTIWIKEGKILAAGHDSTIEGGVKTKINYLEGIIAEAVSKAEDLIKQDPKLGPHSEILHAKMIKRPAEVNFDMDEKIREFINSHNAKIEVRGPVFIGVKIDIS
jgi:O-phosphoseryl-tRNA synthetase